MAERRILFFLSVLIGTLATVTADARGKRRHVEPEPSPTVTATAVPSPSPTASAVPTPKAGEVLAVWGPGASTSLKPGGSDYEYGQRTLAHLNLAYSSGCILEKALEWDFLSLHGVVNPLLQKFQRFEALHRYFAGAPYALDARWYSTWGSVVGYTYNWLDGADSGPSETRVWTNTRKGLPPEQYASHLSHELSHQIRAGGFVHYSFHQGSFPYEIGDIVWACITERVRGLNMLGFGPEVAVPKRKHFKILDTEGCYQ